MYSLHDSDNNSDLFSLVLCVCVEKNALYCSPKDGHNHRIKIKDSLESLEVMLSYVKLAAKRLISTNNVAMGYK